MIKNTGTYFDMRRKRSKIKLSRITLWLLNCGLTSWCIYNVVMIIIKIRVANVFLQVFPKIQ